MLEPVVFVLKGYPRLSETFIAEEIAALEQAGLPIRIVSLRRPTDRITHPVHGRVSALVSYLPEYLHHAPFRVVRSIWRLRRAAGLRPVLRRFASDLRRDVTRNRIRRLGQAFVLAAELPPDVRRLHAHFIHTPASVVSYAAELRQLVWSCSAHAKDIWTTPEWDLRYKLERATFAVTCTAAGRDRLQALSPSKPVHLVYHGLRLDRFVPLTCPSSIRNGRDSADPVRLLSVGRAVEKKGFDLLIDALRALPEGVAWHWTHIGGGPQRTWLQARAASNGIADRIAWEGPRDQDAVLAAYRAADLFILPCRIGRDGDRDGLPNVLVEAQSQGLACISTAVSGVTELIEAGRTGVIVPPERADLLAEAIAALIADPAERRRLGRAGAQRVQQHFDARGGIDQLLTLFTTTERGAGGV